MTATTGPEDPYSRRGPVVVLIAIAVAVLATNWAILDGTDTAPGGVAGISLAVLPNVLSAVLIGIALFLFFGGEVRGASSDDPSVTSQEAVDLIMERLRPSADASTAMRGRDELPQLRELAKDARTISVCAVSGVGLANRRGLWQQCIKEGAHLRVLLLNPLQEDSLTVWDRLSNPPMAHSKRDIESGIQGFHSLTRTSATGRCELRVTNSLLPYTLIWFDYGSGASTIQVEVHAYRRAPDDRPNMLISTTSAPEWVDFFADQFDLAWDSAEEPDTSLLSTDHGQSVQPPA